MSDALENLAGHLQVYKQTDYVAVEDLDLYRKKDRWHAMFSRTIPDSAEFTTTDAVGESPRLALLALFDKIAGVK